MNQSNLIEQLKNFGTGLAFIIFPLIFIFAFSVHPGLSDPHLLNSVEMINRAHHNSLLQFGHVLVTLCTGLLILVALKFKSLLDQSNYALVGLVGTCIAIMGAVFLAVDKGALCLTMTALDSLSASEFAQMMPGLLAIFNKESWMVLVWGIVLLPIGFAIQAVALIKARTLQLWRSICFLIGVLLIGFPDGMEIINLYASILIGIALIPYGVEILHKNRLRKSHSLA